MMHAPEDTDKLVGKHNTANGSMPMLYMLWPALIIELCFWLLSRHLLAPPLSLHPSLASFNFSFNSVHVYLCERHRE